MGKSFTSIVEERSGSEGSDVWTQVALTIDSDLSEITLRGSDGSAANIVNASAVERIISSDDNPLFGFVYTLQKTGRQQIKIFRTSLPEEKDKIVKSYLLPLARNSKAKKHQHGVRNESIFCSVTDVDRFPYHAETSLSNLTDLVGGASFDKVHRVGPNRLKIDIE